MPVKTVAMLTAGGLAPCLSSAVGGLIERYSEVAPDARIIAYKNGYAGLLTGDSAEVTEQVRAEAGRLHAFGGNPIGNSRVKLTNVKDCVKRGLVSDGDDPLHVATAIAWLFIGSMIAIGLGFAIFLIETRVGSRAVRVRTELLQHTVDDAG